MPVMPQINEGLKIGLKYTPSAPPQLVGAIQAGSQAVMAAGALMPMFPVPIPVIPFGAAPAAALTQIEAMANQGFEKASQIADKLMSKYYADLDKKNNQRKSAEEQLYTDEKASQDNMKEESKVLEEEISVLNTEIDTLSKEQQKQIREYNATIFTYKENSKKAAAVGNTVESEMWLSKVDDHDEWLQQILDMTIVIIEKKISEFVKGRDLENLKELIALTIQRDWEWLEEHATDFEVPVPYHPDVPMPPSLPPIGAIIEESPLVKFGRQIFAKWIVAPMIPPIGLIVASVMLMIQNFESTSPAPAAAKAEASADALILQLGGAI